MCCGDVGRCTIGGGTFSLGSDGVGKGVACGGESGLGSGGIGDTLCKVVRYDAEEPRRAEWGGGDGRSEGDTEAADAANTLWAAMR